MNTNFHECQHPLILHKLSYLRQPKEIVNFREYERLIYEISLFLGYEATRDLPLKDIKEGRPGESRDGYRNGQRVRPKPVIIPTVRSGLIIAAALRSIIPTPYMGHIGLYDSSAGVQEFMVVLPDRLENRQYIIADFVIDRGKTATRAIEILLEYGIPAENIIFVCLLISAVGKSTIEENLNPDFKKVRFYCAKLDIGEDRWLPDFQETNVRLFRTTNQRDLRNDML